MHLISRYVWSHGRSGAIPDLPGLQKTSSGLLWLRPILHNEGLKYCLPYFPWTMTEKLNSMQYNVRKSGNRVMAPLLADPIVLQFFLIVFKEPFHSSLNNSTHNPSNTSFHLFNSCVESSQVYFFISKSFNLTFSSSICLRPSYSYLQLKSPIDGAGDIIILYIYRPQDTSSVTSNYPHDSDFSDDISAAPYSYYVDSLFYLAPLDASLDHILLGDFNLCNPLWVSAQVTADLMAGNLLSLLNSHFIHLLLPQGSITQSGYGY